MIRRSEQNPSALTTKAPFEEPHVLAQLDVSNLCISMAKANVRVRVWLIAEAERRMLCILVVVVSGVD